MKAPGKVSQLIEQNRKGIDLLKEVIEKNFPDLKKKKKLNDGTVVDDLFYLRYVLSCKEPLTNPTEILDSSALKAINAAIEWRNNAEKSPLDTSTEKELLVEIPMLKTGELSNQFPVVFLPVKQVKFDHLFQKISDKAFEKKVMNFVLGQKERIFKELDEKTRSSGNLIKSVTVYDLNGISFASIYKLAKFFKILQCQGKKFKQYFPQLTHTTVIINSPGSWILKSFSGSSKQKVMGVKEFFKLYDATSVCPDFVGGEFSWPATPDDLFRCYLEGPSSSMTVKELAMTPLVSQDTIPVKDDESVQSSVPGVVELENLDQVGNQKTNKKFDALEREMIKMKKNKLFSINVLEKNQKVKILFSNMRKKNANILVVVKEKSDAIQRSSTVSGESFKISTSKSVVPTGFGSLSLKMKNPGEVLLVYVDKKRTDNTGLASVETMDLRMGAARKAYQFGRRATKKLTSRNKNQISSMKKLRKNNQLANLMNLDLLKEHNRQMQLQKIKSVPEEQDRVYFRFEVSDAVVCGMFAGDQSLTDGELESLAGTEISPPSLSSFAASLDSKVRRNSTGLIDYSAKQLSDGDSQSSYDYETGMKKKTQASFFQSAAQIFTRGW